MERFWKKVEKTEGCWIWTAHKSPRGYGRVAYMGNARFAHRVAYEDAYGPIPPGMVLDHLCRNTSCVRPDHLEAVTQRENVRRGSGVAAGHARKTHCKHGHEFTHRYRGYRVCGTCVDIRNRKAAEK